MLGIGGSIVYYYSGHGKELCVDSFVGISGDNYV